MGLQHWQVDINGVTQTVAVEHEGRIGSLRVEDCMVAEWKTSEEESSHHLTVIGGHVLGVHLFYSPEESPSWRYDCSLNGISIVTNNSVWVQESTPSEGGYRAWDVDLPQTRIRVGMRHKLISGAVLLELNGETVATLREVEVEPREGDYFLRLLNHRIGIHIRESPDFTFRYDCSLDGRSITTGQAITVAPLLENEGGYAWLEEVDGSRHLFRLEHSPFRNRGTLWVDGERVSTAGSFWNEREENWYSFTWSGHTIMVQAKESGNLNYEYQMAIDGRSVETGARIETGKTSTAPVEEPPSSTLTWKRHLMGSIGTYLFGVVGLLAAAGHWLGLFDPRYTGWYWILPALYALYCEFRETRVEKWLQIGFSILALGVIAAFCFGLLYLWIFT
ncbi:hypothetical protein [Desmospora activa]|uniref:FAIM1 (Fas apoptotic inhibitory molecule) protein n=1 Tax=Desmospora activa DSM 45169 TaxID=1121389 RepID=A0A2T4ZB93_9BACL|nr:hypothetical protein [Desmospora activa]PTM59173.1 FAIM1 (Fas apoptotic inhibitory molecule) protein [Desmospora activa DSM 45169]